MREVADRREPRDGALAAGDRRGEAGAGAKIESPHAKEERRMPDTRRHAYRFGRQRRRAALACATAAGLLSPAAVTPGTLAATEGRPAAAAHAARVLNVRDEAHLRYVKSSGSLIIDEGHANGSFPGWVKVRFAYDGEPTVKARCTISGRSGSVSAIGTARLSNPSSVTPSFRGTIAITSGTGSYSHIHGRGELYGVYNRRTYALTVQAIGKLPY